jgi:hypothetical protein
MTLEWGRPKSPEAYVIAVLKPLGLPVVPERGDGDPLPSYMVTVIPGATSDRVTLCALVQVNSFDATRDKARIAADNADHALMSMNDWDVVTLPDGSTTTAIVDCKMWPNWHEYRDPRVKCYIARYQIELRFTF